MSITFFSGYNESVINVEMPSLFSLQRRNFKTRIIISVRKREEQQGAAMAVKWHKENLRDARRVAKTVQCFSSGF